MIELEILGKYCLGCYKLRSHIDYTSKLTRGDQILNGVYCRGCGGGYEH